MPNSRYQENSNMTVRIVSICPTADIRLLPCVMVGKALFAQWQLLWKFLFPPSHLLNNRIGGLSISIWSAKYHPSNRSGYSVEVYRTGGVVPYYPTGTHIGNPWCHVPNGCYICGGSSTYLWRPWHPCIGHDVC